MSAASIARPRGLRSRTAAALGLIALTLPAGALGAATAQAAQPQAAVTRLSNLHTTTRWAYPLKAAPIHSSPSASSAVKGRLRFLSVDGQAELYVVLAVAKRPKGGSWLQIEVPGRPNGRVGWVRRDALGPLHLVTSYLQIDRETLTARLFKGGQVAFEARVGVGKASTVTPAGHFYVLEKLRPVGTDAFGPFAIGTSAYAPTLGEWPGGGVVGIHGTNEPGLIPGHISHGCVRLRDGDMTRLWHIVGLGTPIEIL
jgi:hypothetical protein